MKTKINCSECLKKQQEIDRLKEENISLKAKLRYQERKITEGCFGSQTPSSKRPFKKNTQSAEHKKRGGAKIGHKGCGRSSLDKDQADTIIRITTFDHCPDCGDKLEKKGLKNRTVFDIEPVEIIKILYEIEMKYCAKCKKRYTSSIPGVLPKCLFSNNLLSHIAIEHYLHGVPLGQLEKKLGIGYGAMVGAMHRLATIMQDVPDKLIESYRTAPVKHADETGWRNNGQNGYAWLFTTPEVSIFRFRTSRSSKVAQEVFGQNPLPGVLVVDRYNGYNKTPCKIQYCYAHLLRTVQDLQKEFPENDEINNFVQMAAPLLSEAMHLRSLPISKQEFFTRAANTKSEIIKMMNTSAQHAAIQKIQNIFREKQDKLYHWADDPDIPAENNFAERELRPIVIARKVSFGSHSDAGARTREILMTTLLSLKKREHNNVACNFTNFLDLIAAKSNKSAFEILFNL